MSSEPSAELLMNISRSRRLIVLLSHAYLEQDWCTNNFRSGRVTHHQLRHTRSLLPSFAAECNCVCVCVCLHRQGLLHLMELVRHPIIFITLEGQAKRMGPEVKQQLSEHQHRLTVLTWKHNSVVGLASWTQSK